MRDDEHPVQPNLEGTAVAIEDGSGLFAPDPVFAGLTEMMRSFVVLAGCLNLSHAVEHLKTTRQTVRRHLRLLEAARGAPLFVVRDRQYALTDAGRQALPEAEYILGRTQGWYLGQIGRIGGMDVIRREANPRYFLQQQPISAVWQDDRGLLGRAVAAWAEAGGALDHPAMAQTREHMIVFRRVREDWICTEVGRKSSFATWYGPTWERSSIGLPLASMPGGRTFARVANRPYDEVEASHGLRLDHIHTTLPREGMPVPQPLSFKRLLIGCRFADGSFALGNIGLRSHDLRIDGVDPAEIRSMAADMVEDRPLPHTPGDSLTGGS